MAIRVVWDKFEVALLIDTYLRVTENRVTKKEAIAELSKTLRQKAIKAGIQIDTVYRNTNGIAMRIANIQYLFTDGKIGLSSYSLLDKQIYELYKMNKEEFSQLLEEAMKMVNTNKSNESQFLTWLSLKVSSAQLSELYMAYDKVNEFCEKNKILQIPLLETTDTIVLKTVKQTLEGNILFRIKNKRQLNKITSAMNYYITFIKEIEESNKKIDMMVESKTNIDYFSLNNKKVDHEDIEDIIEQEYYKKLPMVRNSQDKMLQNMYPEIYNKIYVSLHGAKNITGNRGVTVVSIYENIHRIAQCETIKKILDCASWAEQDGSKYLFSETIVEKNTEYSSSVISAMVLNASNEIIIDFAAISNMAYTLPVSLTYFGDEYSDFRSWTDLYVKTMQLLYEDYPNRIPVGKSFNTEGRIDFGTKEMSMLMQAPKKVFFEMYVETNLSSTDIVKKIKSLLDMCLIDYKNIEIKYQKRVDSLQKSNNTNNEIMSNNVEMLSYSSKQNSNLEPYKNVLLEYFPKGFRIESPLEMRKFKRFFEELNVEAVEDSDEDVGRNICSCGVMYEGRIYLPQTMLSNEVKLKLFDYIYNSFSSGKTILYYKALFKEFSEDFLGHCIYNAEMLKSYLSHVNNGEYHINRSYLTKDANASADPVEEIRTCLSEKSAPMNYEEMFEYLSHIPEQKVKQILAFNSEFISNGRNEYFHISAAILADEEMTDIARIIEFSIKDKNFISGNELIEAIEKKYPYIIEQNPHLSNLGLRDAIGYKLKKQFSFKGNIISKLGQDLSMMDVFADFCKHRSHFTLEELKVLKQELGTVIYFDTVYENSLRISQNEFVSSDQATFKIKETDEAIDRFCTGNYIALSNIIQFGSFPDAGYKWNSYLLEHYVAMYSEKYKLLHTNFNESSCVGAIVKKSSNFDSFDDLIIDVLAVIDKVLNKENALQYLCEEGYLARRSYSNIEQVLVKVKALRNQKGTN